jgi:hypothetical protein
MTQPTDRPAWLDRLVAIMYDEDLDPEAFDGVNGYDLTGEVTAIVGAMQQLPLHVRPWTPASHDPVLTVEDDDVDLGYQVGVMVEDVCIQVFHDAKNITQAPREATGIEAVEGIATLLADDMVRTAAAADLLANLT